MNYGLDETRSDFVIHQHHKTMMDDLNKAMDNRRRFLRFLDHYLREIMGTEDLLADHEEETFMIFFKTKEYHTVLHVLQESGLYWGNCRCLDALNVWDQEVSFSDQGASETLELLNRFYGK